MFSNSQPRYLPTQSQLVQTGMKLDDCIENCFEGICQFLFLCLFAFDLCLLPSKKQKVENILPCLVVLCEIG